MSFGIKRRYYRDRRRRAVSMRKDVRRNGEIRQSHRGKILLLIVVIIVIFLYAQGIL